MANMEPLRREDHPELEDLWRLYDDTMSFVPNSLFTMARRPEILSAFSELIMLDRLPNPRLDPDRPPTISGWEFRAPNSTWVRWDPP